eukprot:TRINITY_DN8047_c0_g2_i3.p1 TRINITY_DN8047_c0_g2~~TRINITY_DN8047_c0_g2_i3.p1  ORF type:complete len:116 (+),score=19.46 TRINITY_DN8047_c0_g2_i3:87-434(+)
MDLLEESERPEDYFKTEIKLPTAEDAKKMNEMGFEWTPEDTEAVRHFIENDYLHSDIISKKVAVMREYVEEFMKKKQGEKADPAKLEDPKEIMKRKQKFAQKVSSEFGTLDSLWE